MTNRAAIPNPALEPLAALIGDWHTTGKHPAVPEKTLHGKASFEWIEGGAFLVMHSQLDDDRFPDGIAIVGSDDAHRAFSWLLRSAGRLQEIRFRVRRPNMELVATGEGSVPALHMHDHGRWPNNGGTREMSKEGGPWEKDLDLTYRRVPQRSHNSPHNNQTV